MTGGEHPTAEHHIGWLITQSEAVNGSPYQQEHLLRLPIHDRPGRSVTQRRNTQ
jgi:hypothetical protein